MKVKNVWVWSKRVKVLNAKLEGLVKQYVGQVFSGSTEKSIYAIVRGFVLREGLPDDTALLVKLEKIIQPHTMTTIQIFKGIQILI